MGDLENTAPTRLYKSKICNLERMASVSLLPLLRLYSQLQLIYTLLLLTMCAPSAFFNSGIGSSWHVETAAMANAFEANRILWEEDGQFLATTSYCENITTHSCYFLPISNCTLENSNLSQKDLDSAPMATPDLLMSPNVRVIKMNHRSFISNQHVPKKFVQMLAGVGIQRQAYTWWWRAQSIAYLLRPNARTLAELQLRLRDKLVGRTLPQGCISLYVRHGDKGKETKLFDDTAYEAAVHRLRGIDGDLSQEVFLSTEDPLTINYFTNASRGLPTSYIQMRRK